MSQNPGEGAPSARAEATSSSKGSWKSTVLVIFVCLAILAGFVGALYWQQMGGRSNPLSDAPATQPALPGQTVIHQADNVHIYSGPVMQVLGVPNGMTSSPVASDPALTKQVDGLQSELGTVKDQLSAVQNDVSGLKQQTDRIEGSVNTTSTRVDAFVKLISEQNEQQAEQNRANREAIKKLCEEVSGQEPVGSAEPPKQ